ncbi:hypothetical protein F4778DRAFT_66305 [Xylariomycetidae sp. FL2044]|nr:hypothetical protein F4778DRAFT_66305 [Xylariomycetidae sp. FL2044]
MHSPWSSISLCAPVVFGHPATASDDGQPWTWHGLEPETIYCMEGFPEPLRAYDGLCGPDHDNATCWGATEQCCNSKTWTYENPEYVYSWP